VSAARSEKLEPRRLALVEEPSLERRIALDLLAVLEAEAPGVNFVEIGWELAAEARRRETQGTSA